MEEGSLLWFRFCRFAICRARADDCRAECVAAIPPLRAPPVVGFIASHLQVVDCVMAKVNKVICILH